MFAICFLGALRSSAGGGTLIGEVGSPNTLLERTAHRRGKSMTRFDTLLTFAALPVAILMAALLQLWASGFHKLVIAVCIGGICVNLHGCT